MYTYIKAILLLWKLSKYYPIIYTLPYVYYFTKTIYQFSSKSKNSVTILNCETVENDEGKDLV